jgi:hypothetical protein
MRRRIPDSAGFHYDGSGQRVRKTIALQSGSRVEQRIYIGGFELFFIQNAAGIVERWETLALATAGSASP